MLGQLINDLEKGVQYGVSRGLEFAMQDPEIREEKPDDVYYMKSFCIAASFGRIMGGSIALLFIDVPTLGLLPLYNYYKHRKNYQQT